MLQFYSTNGWITEMRRDDIAIAELGEESTLAYENVGLAVWVAYSGHENGKMAWFDFRAGRIVVKNPDDELLSKLKRIAAHFSASVVGDDGEHY